MPDEFSKAKHILIMENRERLELEGIKAVDAFNEEVINASTDWGDLLIKGSELHIDVLDLETGIVKIKGNIGAVAYSDRSVAKGLFKRAFSQ